MQCPWPPRTDGWQGRWLGAWRQRSLGRPRCCKGRLGDALAGIGRTLRRHLLEGGCASQTATQQANRWRSVWRPGPPARLRLRAKAGLGRNWHKGLAVIGQAHGHDTGWHAQRRGEDHGVPQRCQQRQRSRASGTTTGRGRQGTIPRPSGGAMKINRAAKQTEHEVLPASWVAGRGGAPGAAFACHGWVRPPARPPPLAVWAWSAKRCHRPSKSGVSPTRPPQRQRSGRGALGAAAARLGPPVPLANGGARRRQAATWHD